MRFVVHQHHATGLHWDLRLEAEDGTLKSWAVPRGPSLDPGARRLAMRTEDHELAYLGFEGMTGGGSGGSAGGGPGSGPVIVWDEGDYTNRTTERSAGAPPAPVSVVDAVDRGHVSVTLRGHKLSGGFALTRTGTHPRERWILVKRRDAGARADADVVEIVVERPESVRSGLTIEQLRRSAVEDT